VSDPARATEGANPHEPRDPREPRTVLLAERDRLRAELAVEIQAPGQMTYGSQAAAATQVFEQQRDLALRERNAQHLAEVEAALARLDAGTYGRCLRCGNPVAAERLQAIPWAAHCIDCQRAVGRG
jgi:DnaK suppressor protein